MRMHLSNKRTNLLLRTTDTSSSASAAGGFRKIGPYSEAERLRGDARVSVAAEEQRIRSLFERVETIEEVARTLPEDDQRRAKLLAVSRDALAEEATVRPVIAAKILGLSEKTVRAWATAGLLATKQKSPRLLLDVPSVHAISHVLREVRADGLDHDLLDHVWHRLEDRALLEREDLRESIEQLRRGEVIVLRSPRPENTGSTD
jgi:hypothetical protein